MDTDKPRHSVSVAAVIADDHERVLLIQRADNGNWESPGGVLELNETIEDGLRREVREETGLHVEPQQLTGVYKNMTRGVVALVFRCKITGGQPATSDEAAAFRWASKADVCALVREVYAVRILDALSSNLAPAVRAHDGTRLV
jgi:8-oxo-dGTP diphosphatase